MEELKQRKEINWVMSYKDSLHLPCGESAKNMNRKTSCEAVRKDHVEVIVA